MVEEIGRGEAVGGGAGASVNARTMSKTNCLTTVAGLTSPLSGGLWYTLRIVERLGSFRHLNAQY